MNCKRSSRQEERRCKFRFRVGLFFVEKLMYYVFWGVIAVYMAVSYLAENKLWGTISNILQMLSYVAAILGVGAVFIAVLSFRKSLEDKSEANRKERLDYSMTILHRFSTTIIPEMEKVRETYKKLVKSETQEALRQINSSLVKGQPRITEDKLSKDVITKIHTVARTKTTSIVQVFNDLEEVAAYVNQGLVDTDVIFGPLHKVTLDFISDNIIVIDIIKRGDPEVPFSNVREMYKAWSKRAESENVEKKISELQKKKDQLDAD